jgi:hypothetical protein
MEVTYDSRSVPYISSDFVEKLCDRFGLDDKTDHFYIDDIEEYDKELENYITDLKKEKAGDIDEFEKDAAEFRKFLEKRLNDRDCQYGGVEFCAGW